MTSLLNQAIERLKSLPEPEQDDLARLLLHELDEHRRWTETSHRHEDGLKRLADSLLRDVDQGAGELLNPDTL